MKMRNGLKKMKKNIIAWIKTNIDPDYQVDPRFEGVTTQEDYQPPPMWLGYIFIAALVGVEAVKDSPKLRQLVKIFF